jgi:lactoylglutathione lyase
MVAKETPESTMRYLHTMIRAANLDDTLDFFVDKLGLVEAYRYDNEAGRFTLVFLSAPEDLEAAKARQAPLVEITYNWDPEQYDGGRNFGHLAYQVDDIYATCQDLLDKGMTLNRPPRDGRMAFIKSPDGISIELLQAGEALPTQEPWASMPNTGNW